MPTIPYKPAKAPPSSVMGGTGTTGAPAATETSEERGRMLMYQQFMPNQGEASILTIPGPEWRTNVDIAIDPKAIDPTGSTANQNLALALVRLYANQGSARSEIARGRVPHLNADNVTVPARRVIRARSEGADSYEVTIQAERGSLVMTGISPQPVVTAMLWG